MTVQERGALPMPTPHIHPTASVPEPVGLSPGAQVMPLAADKHGSDSLRCITGLHGWRCASGPTSLLAQQPLARNHRALPADVALPNLSGGTLAVWVYPPGSDADAVDGSSAALPWPVTRLAFRLSVIAGWAWPPRPAGWMIDPGVPCPGTAV
ncbi:hypothetical protein GCM10010411_75780 [Actinomadura fulvescens]|uniref:Uncharacterized protein n=1 Tax=Actinomadura fulvescens TaxID=46160 RepID=A0ABN3QK71_9ACTN